MRPLQKLSQAQEIIMVKDLQRIMPINELQAREILLQTSWNLQRANNIILDLQGKSHNAEESFRKYAKGDLIEDQGIINFCKDLGIDLMDPIILYISYSFKAERMGQFTKFDFIYGFNQLKIVDTIDLRNRIPKLREEFKKLEVFKSVYKFCFDFAKEKKDLPYEIAQGLWDTLLKPLFPIMNKFLEYVESIPEQQRQPITRDTYLMVLEFCLQIGSDLTKYDYKNGAWPIFLDNFYYFIYPDAKNQQGYY